MTDLIAIQKIAGWEKLKTMVLDSVSSPITKRVYNMALDEFLAWFQQAPRPGFTKATVSAWRVSLEARGLGSSSIIIRMSAIRKLAAEAADNGLLAPELAAGISRVKSAKTQGIRTGNWLSQRQAQALLSAPDITTLRGLRDRAILAVLLGCGLRRSEVAALMFSHLQQRYGRWCIVDLVGKHGRVRTAPMPTWVKVAIDAWTLPADVTEGHVYQRRKFAVFQVSAHLRVALVQAQSCSKPDTKRSVKKLPGGVTPINRRRNLAGATSLTPDSNGIREQLERILASDIFARSERMSRFLRFIVGQLLEGHEDQIKASVIGVEVYDRPADYDPKDDPIVRNDARRLRAKLREYYDSEGRQDPIVIELPKGTYVPALREVAVLRIIEEAPAKRPRTLLWTMATAACVILLLGTGVFLLRSRATKARGTRNLEALYLYQQGEVLRRQGNQRPPEQLHAAAYFKQAIARDPKYTLAYIGLSDALFRAYIGQSADAALIADAENAARKAVQLDASLALAQVMLGQILAMKRDWAEADREFTSALRLDPENGDAHLIYAVSDLALSDRLDLATAEANRAVLLDPFLSDGYGWNALLLLCAHRFDEAIDMARKDLELHPRSEGSQNTLGRAFVQKGMVREGRRHSPRRTRWAGEHTGPRAWRRFT